MDKAHCRLNSHSASKAKNTSHEQLPKEVCLNSSDSATCVKGQRRANAGNDLLLLLNRVCDGLSEHEHLFD